ncbi:MAG TPA: transposase [Candidatus Acidoferrales bacterium]|nr:transposase [Candidatus Acidoferrales bacterium]
MDTFAETQHRKGELAVEERSGGTNPPKLYRTVEEKRQIVEETLVPGASVARVARAHGVNANQVFGWRQLYRQGCLERKEDTRSLLPVRVTSAAVAEPARPSSIPAKRNPCGMIHVELPTGQVRITGRVDAEVLRVVLEKLLA